MISARDQDERREDRAVTAIRRIGKLGTFNHGVTRNSARVRMQLESRPENVALVRAALSGLAEALDLGEELLADLKTAVSEACNNVVVHAYGDAAGPMAVDIIATPGGVAASVTDHGCGLHQLTAADPEHMGLGLALISALAQQSEFRMPEGGGTEVRMRFRRDPMVADHEHEYVFPEGDAIDPNELAGDVVVEVAPPTVMRFVLGRISRAIAAMSRFSTERFADLYPVNEAFADYVEYAADGAVGIAISGSSRRLTVTVGPLITRHTEGRVPAADSGELRARHQALEQLADDLSFERRERGELVRLVLSDERPAS